jgi:hypothetical protein
MTIMSKSTASYLAGYLDGEGYFGIIPRFHKSSYAAKIKVASTNKETIDWLKNSFGGSVNKRTFPNKNNKDAYCWTLEGKNILPFLLRIYPYLKIKREQCKLLIDFKKIDYQKYNCGARKGVVFPQEIKDKIYFLYSEIRRLNQRGNSLHAERLSEKTPNGDTIV